MLQWAGFDARAVEEVWPTAGPMIELALRHSDGEFSAEDILEMLLERRAQFWAIGDEQEILAVFVTWVVVFPQFSILEVLCAGGKGIGDWASYISVFEAFAAEQGCRKLRWFGRDGLVKVMEKFGFHKRYTVMSKDVAVESKH